MDRPSTEYAVDIQIPGIKVRIKSEKCLIWVCVTTLASLSLLVILLAVARPTLRA